MKENILIDPNELKPSSTSLFICLPIMIMKEKMFNLKLKT